MQYDTYESFLQAIEDGLYSPTLKAKVEDLEAEAAALRTRLESVDDDRNGVVEMHAAAPERYRRMIEDLPQITGHRFHFVFAQ